MSKTIEDFLNELPDPYKEKALQNTIPENLSAEAYDMADALAGAFIWDSTPEGAMYWIKILKDYGFE